jgi:hypothetical protein
MGCSLSTGQLALTFNESLQCTSQDNKTIVFNSSLGNITQIDSNIAKLLKFNFNSDGSKTPYITYIGIAPLTNITLIFQGNANVTDPAITALVTLSIDNTGKNINIGGVINQTIGNKQLVQLNSRTMSTNAHVNLMENFPSCVNHITDIIPQLPLTFTIANVQSSIYTYTLTQINFNPVAENFVEHFSGQTATSDNNMIIFLVIALIILVMLYIYTCYKSDKII